MTGMDEMSPEYRMTPSMRDTQEFCLQNGSDEYSQITVEVYVEGSQDVKFYESWVDNSKLDEGLDNLSIVVKTINDVDDDEEDLETPENAIGNCVRVREFAKLNENYIRKIWISDRDLMTDEDLKSYSQSNLFFTDFPAIESYGFLPEVLSRVNKYMYKSRLKALDACFDFVRDYLRGVYFYRCNLQLVENPPKVKVWRNGTLDKLEEYVKMNTENQSIDDFIEFASGVIPEEIVEKMSSVNVYNLDPRTYAYGHDIAPAIKRFIAFEEKSLEGKAKGIKDIESSILENYIDGKFYTRDCLFTQLGERIKYVHNELKVKN